MARLVTSATNGLKPSQLKKLVAKLDRRHVHQRQIEGKTVAYIEGWFAISEANAIFGFDGWDRETLHLERLYEQNRNQETQCAYSARVRVRIKAGSHTIVREGSGFGQATARTRADAHDRALKTAETDATKRALATFGNRFGLCLYDKDQAGLTADHQESAAPQRVRFSLKGPVGEVLDDDLSAEAFCTGLRQVITQAKSPLEIDELANTNVQALHELRVVRADLVSAKGVHFADILERLLRHQKQRLQDKAASSAQAGLNSPTPEGDSTVTSPATPMENSNSADKILTALAAPNRIDKSVLPIGTERRIRNKVHLAFVGSQPCLICSELPSHAHHLTFAQPRGLSIKVSDEFTVPLCPVHHNLLHQSANERAFWRQHGIDALQSAAQFWARSMAETV